MLLQLICLLPFQVLTASASYQLLILVCHQLPPPLPTILYNGASLLVLSCHYHHFFFPTSLSLEQHVPRQEGRICLLFIVYPSNGCSGWMDRNSEYYSTNTICNVLTPLVIIGFLHRGCCSNLLIIVGFSWECWALAKQFSNFGVNDICIEINRQTLTSPYQ